MGRHTIQGSKRAIPDSTRSSTGSCRPPSTRRVRLLTLLQWRAGLRISEALDVEPADVRFDSPPTVRVRNGKGGKPRIVPLHRELGEDLAVALDYGKNRTGPIVDVRRR